MSLLSASWKKQKQTLIKAHIATWNTQDKNGRALEQFTRIRIPDVLLVQEAGSAPWGGTYNAKTGETTGSTTVNRSKYGSTDTIKQKVYFAHVDTGSKNLMILSHLPITNAHLIDVSGGQRSSDWRFRPALAAQIGGVNFVNIHLVSGVPKLAAKHLASLYESIESSKPTFVGGDANMDSDMFDDVTHEADVEIDSYSAEEPTHKGGGYLDHGAFMGDDEVEVSHSTTHAKGSDHKMRIYRAMWSE